VPEDQTSRVRELADAAQRGDEDAYGELVGLFSTRLCAFFRMIGVPGSEAEDLAQETFIKAHRALSRYDARYAFSTWLFTIGRRLAISRARGARPVTIPIEASGELQAPAEPSPEAGAAVDRIWDRAAAILPARQHEALWLRYGEEKSLAEVASIMDISGMNARVMLHRARTRLAQALRQTERRNRASGSAWRPGAVRDARRQAKRDV
jgi:RNA polymerase sigma-70 factor, ECF subfamily